MGSMEHIVYNDEYLANNLHVQPQIHTLIAFIIRNQVISKDQKTDLQAQGNTKPQDTPPPQILWLSTTACPGLPEKGSECPVLCECSSQSIFEVDSFLFNQGSFPSSIHGRRMSFANERK